ncbi:MAG TPA: RNA methyltransferase [Xanthobacteraceae bacterium]|nr:RNA methyltransferase [Xanthobacteraceae bacterium]
MTECVTIARMGQRGDGIVEDQHAVLYVPHTLPGETAVVEPVAGHPDRRRLVALQVASPARVAAICPHFGICGGCAVQHWAFAPYRAWKRNLVIEAFAQVGLEAPVEDLVDAHGAGRRRAVFHARFRSHGIIEVGFAAYRRHQIVPIDRCPVLAPELAGAIAVAWRIAEVLAPGGKPLDIQVTATEAGLDVDVRGSGPLRASAIAQLATVAEAHALVRLTRHGERLLQQAAPVVQMGRARLELPPGAFLQATAAGEATLAALVVALVGSATVVADLFAGVGPFALRLAERAQVTAIDRDQAALAALDAAAKATPGLKPIAAVCRDLFRRPCSAAELARFEACVFDPPRQGAQAQAQALADSRVGVIIAVSCNPSTLARDARLLVDGGYRLTRVMPVDQFRYTPHVEVVAVFVRP